MNQIITFTPNAKRITELRAHRNLAVQANADIALPTRGAWIAALSFWVLTITTLYFT